MKTILYTLMIMTLTLMVACDEEYLEKKPNKSIVVPSTLEDFQALLDNTQVMNIAPGLGIIGTDNLFTTDEGWLFYSEPERNSYTWEKDIYKGIEYSSDWNIPYQQVFYANVVLEGLKDIPTNAANKIELQAIQGSALFYRAHAFYHLAQLFAPVFDESNADTPGIPLRLTADVNAAVTRASVKETYGRIVGDLKRSLELLPATSAVKTRPTKASASALLARVFLSMEDYVNAETYATHALSENSYLLDFNTLSVSSLRPIPRMNDEILFHSTVITYRFTTSAQTYVDTTLYAEYHLDDLRKSVFFRQRSVDRYTFKGNYSGSVVLFGGISNDEVFLTRAECRVRNGDIPGALEDLNTLLEKRWKTGTFTPISETDPELLLMIILTEREKELLFRVNRWTDLKRLNKDERFKQTLSRKLNDTNYLLPPGDARYVYPIPDQEIKTSGISQNPR